MAVMQKGENPHQSDQGQTDVGQLYIWQPD